ncbi:ABC transporter substrate-binding protein [Amycolatopsis pithecellobii]|nr:ABC transporter substrate-binding protein [Amycolatopsis pithecellobii]
MTVRVNGPNRATSTGRARLLAAVAGAVVALSLTITACGSDSTADDGNSGPLKIRVAYGPGFGSLPVVIAAEKGYFKANGLDVTLTEGLDLAAYLGALGAQFDVVMGLPPGILQASGRGVALTVISGLNRTDAAHVNNPVLTKDATIKSAADLAGKTVGVPTLTGISADAVRYVVRQQTGKDVKLVQVPPDAMADQITAGRIDAAVSAIPYFTGVESRGIRVLDDVVIQAVKLATGNKDDSALLGAFIATPSYVDKHPEVATAWRKSLQQGADFIAANEKEARAILQQHAKLPAAVAANAPLPNFVATTSAADFQPFVTIGETIGSLRKTPDLGTLIHQEK